MDRPHIFPRVHTWKETYRRRNNYLWSLQIKVVPGEVRERPWWENNATIASLILGLPVVGLISIGLLSIIGVDTSEFPAMFSAEFFMTDLGLRLLTLPIGIILIRSLVRRMVME